MCNEYEGFLCAPWARAGSEDGPQPAGLREGGLGVLKKGRLWGPMSSPWHFQGGYLKGRAHLLTVGPTAGTGHKLDQKKFRLASEFQPELSIVLIFSLCLGFSCVKCKSTYKQYFQLTVVP